MSEKKSSMVKDAVILCLITLILGAVLAGVYAVTKAPIEAAQIKANNEACAAVVAEGDKVQDSDAGKVENAAAYFGGHGLANEELTAGDTLGNYVEVSEVHPTDKGGTVYLAAAKKGYGGEIGFALGVDEKGAITGISITSQSETAGLGANCVNKEWQDGFVGKTAPETAGNEMYSKNGATESQVQAISGATVTSRGITRAVKAILFYDESVRGAK